MESLRKECAALVQTHCVNVCALVFRPVTGVAEGFLTARVLTRVRLLSGMASQVDLQVLQTGERLLTALKLSGGGRESKRKRHERERFISSLDMHPTLKEQ